MEYLDKTVCLTPDKTAFSNGVEDRGLTFRELYRQARGVGSFFAEKYSGKPVVVFMKKSAETAAAFFGVIYSGNFYVPLDEEMPRQRLELIIQTLNPAAVICSADTEKSAASLNFDGMIYRYEEICQTPADDEKLAEARRGAIDTDPAYVVFTSGSTGVPKGVAASHRSVIDYIDNLTEVLDVSEETVFGSQTPLYVDACLKELISTIKCGATAYFIPKSLFMFPARLVEYLNTNKVNTVCWVVTALTMISGLGALEKNVPKHLTTVAFGSEIFPVSQFNKWRTALPDARFINLYGPTEATGMSCWYEVTRDFEPDEAIPIGRPFKNTGIMLLDGDTLVTEPDSAGEICIRGTCLALGYYNDFSKTRAAFTQNPLNSAYPDLIYRTGDLGRYNKYGELVYISRKDYQIKHQGHRIELAEIEAAAGRTDDISASCCIYDENKGKIILFYAGKADMQSVAAFLREALPRYMVPSSIIKLDVMPVTHNMKIDRTALKQRVAKEKI